MQDHTMQDDIKMFARALRSRLGTGAQSYALDHAARLEECGDRQGHQVWREVAETVARLPE